MKVKSLRIPLLILLVSVLCLVSFGCAQTERQGWSGFAGYDGILYFGSMNGEVFAINPAVRSQEQPFPGEGEWRFDKVKSGMPTGSLCGPVGCMPSAAAAVLYSTPAVSEALVYVATYAGESGKVMAISRLEPGYAEGVPMRSKGEWIYPGETKYIGSVVGDLVLDGDTLFVASSNGRLYAIDAAYGEKRWEFDTGGKIWTTPAVENGVVYVSNYAKQLYAIKDGKELWHKDYPAAIASSLAISENSIFFGTFDQNLYAVSKIDGSETWKFRGEDWFWAKPTVKDGIVYAGCLDQKIYALDASSGKEIWQFAGDGRIVTSPISWGDFVVAISEAGEIYVLESQTGALQRKTNIGYTTMAPLYLADDLVFVHGRDRTVYCVDVQKGEIAWKFPYVAK